MRPRSAPPRPVLMPATDPPSRRPDPAPALIAAAFALGVVLTAVVGIALDLGHGPSVPASDYNDLAARKAAAEAASSVQQQRLDAQAAVLDEVVGLSRRLATALDDPDVSTAQLAALRARLERTVSRIESVRVVRVPGPTVVVRAPAPAAAVASPSPTPASAPSSTPTPCSLQALGFCLLRDPAQPLMLRDTSRTWSVLKLRQVRAASAARSAGPARGAPPPG